MKSLSSQAESVAVEGSSQSLLRSRKERDEVWRLAQLSYVDRMGGIAQHGMTLLEVSGATAANDVGGAPFRPGVR